MQYSRLVSPAIACRFSFLKITFYRDNVTSKLFRIVLKLFVFSFFSFSLSTIASEIDPPFTSKV